MQRRQEHRLNLLDREPAHEADRREALRRHQRMVGVVGRQRGADGSFPRARQFLEADDIGISRPDRADNRCGVLIGRQDVEGHRGKRMRTLGRAIRQLGQEQRPKQRAKGDGRQTQAQQQAPGTPPEAGCQERGQWQKQVLGDRTISRV